MMQDTSPSVFTKEKLLRLNEIPTAIKFSPNGQYLAVGFANGSLALLDMSRLELAHLHNRTIFESIGILPVTSICWGRQSRSLVSCTLDGYVRIFDVPSGEYLVSHKLDQGSVPTDIELHPEDKNICLLSLVCGNPILMDLESGVQSEVGVLPDKKHPPKKQSRVEIKIHELHFFAAFSRSGQAIHVVGKKEGILLYEGTVERDHQCVLPLPLPSPVAVKWMTFNQAGTQALLHCTDNALRILWVQENRIQNLTTEKDTNPWKSCCFSSDESLVVGVKNSDDGHEICIWRIFTGEIVGKFHMRNDIVLELAHHPFRNIMVTSSRSQSLRIWSNESDAKPKDLPRINATTTIPTKPVDTSGSWTLSCTPSEWRDIITA